MKRILIILLLVAAGSSAYANHLKGGFFTYEYLGKGIIDTNKLRYTVTLTIYMQCEPTTQQQDASVPFTFFDASTHQQITNPSVALSSSYNLYRGDNQCIADEKTGCIYHVRVYTLASVELAPNAAGYIIAFQRCCRIGQIVNVPNPSNQYGSTYSINIPGTNAGPTAFNNKSAAFLVNDTAVVCGGSYFQVPFIAFDNDSTDQLQYSFCDAYIGGGQGGGSNPAAASSPPYSTLPYSAGFSGNSPLGPSVTIDPQTGVISGIAPDASGEYVITVCITEFRGGIPIATTRKELHINVGSCTSADAALPQAYSKCESYTYKFANLVPPNEAIKTYYWEFGDGNSSMEQSPSHTYADTGSYIVKLVVNRNGTCSDSTTSVVRVYPGFKPGFNFTGICIGKPTQFADTSKSGYGVINKWSWDFGVETSSADVSPLQHPSYTYMSTGVKPVRLIVSDSKGCLDTVTKNITILDRPPLSVSFKDTLICKGDTLRLKAIGNGTFRWTPLTNITDPNVADPVVDPIITTRYKVELNDNGCLNEDTVRVRVVNFVTLQAMPDTVICLTDSVMLRANTNGLKFLWTPSAGMNDPTLLKPKVMPAGTTVYQLTAYIGSCNATDDVRVTTVPYPISNAGADTVICDESHAQLHGSTDGNAFAWSPAGTLTNSNTLQPVAMPVITREYVLTVTDDRGCPKPVRDTVIVTVLPPIVPAVRNDTAVVVGQPLQFKALGGVRYQWTPASFLSSSTTGDPIGIYDGSVDSIRYTIVVFNEADCVDSVSITVKIFRTDPRVFVPTAFTPNGDGRNDLLRPLGAGIARIKYFKVYNRWGQVVFETTINGQGWNGKVDGKDQGTEVFVWVVSAIDHKGETFFAKGTVTLLK